LFFPLIFRENLNKSPVNFSGLRHSNIHNLKLDVMKQLALVLLIAATSLSVSAQKDYRYNNRNKDKYDRVDRYEDKRDRFDSREKEEFRRQLERINHEYDSRIRSVSHSWTSR